MKKSLSGLVFVVIAFFAVKYFIGGGGAAIRYNDRIVDSQGKIILKIFDLAKAFEKSDPDEMDAKLLDLQTQIDESLVTVSAMESFDGYVRLRDAAIELFKFYQDISREEYQEIVEILSQPQSDITKDDYYRLQDIQADVEEREADLDKELQAAQQEFAKIHGFQVKANKYQKQIDRM